MALTPDDVLGQLDDCRPEHEFGRIDHRLLLARDEGILVRGWAFGRSGGALDVEIAREDQFVTIPAVEERPDVAVHHGRAARRSGFKTLVEIDEPPVDPLELDVFVRYGDAPVRLKGAPVSLFRTGAQLPDVPVAGDGAHGRFRKIADADPLPLPRGWPGHRSIRLHKPIEFRGWALDPSGKLPESTCVIVENGIGLSRRYPSVPCHDGEATAAARSASQFNAGFVCALGPDELPAGLYSATVIVQVRDGTWWRGPRELFQVVGEGAVFPPLFLPIATSAPEGHLEEVSSLDVVRGTPVSLRGWAADPTTGLGANVYAAFDERRPCLVASLLPRPDLSPSSDGRVGFAGIAETADLLAGEHRLRILALAKTGALWYQLAECTVQIADTAR